MGHEKLVSMSLETSESQSAKEMNLFCQDFYAQLYQVVAIRG